jgi:ABC-2 type transport system ATP-binding protein
LAYVPGDVVLWPHLTGEETLELFARLGPPIDRAYRAELVDRFQLDVSKLARAYSSGNRQKVALVAAFATRAELLVMDEPSGGLDPLMDIEFRRCVTEAADRGQTVFLSSHVLSEVEVLCHRVGILRTGRLVEVAGIDELQRLRSLTVDVTFSGPAPTFEGVPGVEAVDRLGADSIRLRLSGSPAATLRALAGAEVVTIEMKEASLEEIFLTYYGDPGAPRPDAGPEALR